jgi:hypothetical protein
MRIKTLVIISLAASSAAAQVIVGTNSFDVVFEATNLTPVAQSRIIDDINICRQLWTNSEVCLDISGAEPHIGDWDVIFKPYFNDMRVPRNLVTNSTGALSLLVEKQVSDAYLDAFKFADANSNIISAAWTFVNTISNTNIICNTRTELSEYVLISPDTNVILPIWFTSFTELEYSPPSVMSFGYITQELEAMPGVASNLFMRLQCRLADNVDQYPCIWHDNKWKFYVWSF